MISKRAWCLLLCVFLLCVGAACADGTITSREQLNQPGRKIGVGTGSASAAIAEKEFPQATIVYFTENVSAYQNVAQGKADAYVFERSQMQMALDNGLQGVHLLDENLEEKIHIAVGISPVSKIPDLKEKLNTFIAEIRANGILDEMYDRWVNQKNETMPAITPAEHPAFTLKVGTSGIVPPFSYYTGQELKGYDIELAYRFAAWLGADVSFSVFDYDAIVPAAASGKVDCLMANLNVTPERAEAIPFSDDLYTADIGILVRGDAAAAAGGTSFGSEISESFWKTFIRENRWRLFVDGVITTLLITVLSILFGTLLGFLAFMLCRNGNPVANGIARFCMWLVQGMPMVVLLMVLYYIVFSSVAINGIAVAVIGFTLTFGSEVFGLLKMSVGTINRGQYEASYALGYSNRHTFFRIILPQAIPHILPAYKGEVVGLIKATAIVGYIAVQDLTKMGDIVRSRTYEAFFPLIAVTIIYFLLEGLLAFVIKRLLFRVNPKKRRMETILKGIRLYAEDDGAGEGEEEVRGTEEAAPAGQQPRETPIIRIEHLKKVYPNITPLEDVSADIRAGDVISVIGPSGTGKSTLLRCINLLEKPTEGHIWVSGTEVTAPGCDLGKVRQKMGMVFQSFNLFGHLTVIENIMLAPMDLKGKSRQDAYDEGMRLLRTVGLAEKALNYPDELSGGQKQRIAIARTLAMDPEIILLDEPTSALDPTMVGEVQAVIRDLATTGKTMMIVTHEMNFARAISNRVFFMDEGGIYEDGTPEQIYDNPQKENTRRFIRKLKVLELSIESRDYDFLATAGEIDKYCRKNQIPWKTAHRIRLAFEELVHQTLIPALGKPMVRIAVEYSEVTESTIMTIQYNGPAFDVTATEDGLSRKVLESTVSEIAYERTDHPECPNQVTLHIRAE